MEITQEKIMQIGFSIMQDPELMMKLAQAESARAAFDLIADKLEGLTFEEFVATVASLAPMIPQVSDEELAAMPNGPLFIKIKKWIQDLPVA
ncbi:MAG: hypothetical protein MSA77_10510 [Selenomonadales bacterium]|nr:hypothetical protein [Selenomonadales bacterium]